MKMGFVGRFPSCPPLNTLGLVGRVLPRSPVLLGGTVTRTEEIRGRENTSGRPRVRVSGSPLLLARLLILMGVSTMQIESERTGTRSKDSTTCRAIRMSDTDDNKTSISPVVQAIYPGVGRQIYYLSEEPEKLSSDCRQRRFWSSCGNVFFSFVD